LNLFFITSTAAAAPADPRAGPGNSAREPPNIHHQDTKARQDVHYQRGLMKLCPYLEHRDV
jgi:hypothetical protein